MRKKIYFFEVGHFVSAISNELLDDENIAIFSPYFLERLSSLKKREVSSH